MVRLSGDVEKWTGLLTVGMLAYQYPTENSEQRTFVWEKQWDM